MATARSCDYTATLAHFVANFYHVLRPNVKATCYVDLVHPEIDDVKIIIKEDLRFVWRCHFKIVVTSCEVPLGLSHELKCRDPVQRDNIVGLVWKLVDRLVRDEHTLDRI